LGADRYCRGYCTYFTRPTSMARRRKSVKATASAPVSPRGTSPNVLLVAQGHVGSRSEMHLGRHWPLRVEPGGEETSTEEELDSLVWASTSMASHVRDKEAAPLQSVHITALSGSQSHARSRTRRPMPTASHCCRKYRASSDGVTGAFNIACIK
jgi:hypothetical protein